MNDLHEFLVTLACFHSVRTWRAPENLEVYSHIYCPICRENRTVMSLTDIDELADESANAGDSWRWS